MFVFDLNDTAPTVEAPITLNNGSFSVTLREPTIDERIADEGMASEFYRTDGVKSVAAYKARYSQRLTLVVGWSGISDAAGNPVPFSSASLAKLLGKFPAVMEQIAPVFAKLYSTEDTTIAPAVAA